MFVHITSGVPEQEILGETFRGWRSHVKDKIPWQLPHQDKKTKDMDVKTVSESFNYLEASKYQMKNPSHLACLTFLKFSVAHVKTPILEFQKIPKW